MTCYCCGMELVRGTDKPDARWMRLGDQYCKECDFVIPREQLVDGWPAKRMPCPEHRRATSKGVT